jgi:uncharacterized protein (TIGR01777 family)
VKILISGASGMVGSELVRQLASENHEVTALVRRPASSSQEVTWDPSAGSIPQSAVEGADAVINLSGASLGQLPWLPGYKKTIRQSRLDTTRTLAAAIHSAASPPAVFLSASAVGIYGDRPGETLTETSTEGVGFLADVVEEWELAARLTNGSTRLVSLRTGLVLGAGGSLAPIVALSRMGLGTRLGDGRAHWPWIGLYDEAAAIRHLLTSSLDGPVNLTGPTRATSGDITRFVAEKLHRPYFLRVPRWVILAALQEAGSVLLFASQDVSSALLQNDGFEFRDSTIEQAINAFL